MKICITAQSGSLDAQVDPRFGRCQFFIFMDTETKEFKAVKNPNIEAMGGAGIQSGQFVAEKEAKVVLTGNVGPNAFETLKAAGIDVVTGVSGTIQENIDKYTAGELKPIQAPTVGSKFGLPGKNEQGGD